MKIKKILIIFFLLITQLTFSQKNDIKIYPLPIKGTSVINISVEQKGNYIIKIKNEKDELIFERNLFIKKIKGFKHDFLNYTKGEFTFSIYKEESLLFAKKYIKK